MKRSRKKENPLMKYAILLSTIILVSILLSFSQVWSATAEPGNRKATVEEKIWAMGEVALTQYTLHVNSSVTAGGMKTQSSRITHTWVKEDGSWKLLGGMSYDK